MHAPDLSDYRRVTCFFGVSTLLVALAAVWLPLGFGVALQLPPVMLLLERTGVLTVEWYLEKWRMSMLVLAIVAMILSPGGDPHQMLLILVSLAGCYFAVIALCKWLPRARSAAG